MRFQLQNMQEIESQIIYLQVCSYKGVINSIIFSQTQIWPLTKALINKQKTKHGKFDFNR